MKLKSKDTSGSNQEHALLSPSSAKKWIGCPAALACEFGIPNESGQAAVLGTAMHTVAEVQLNQYIRGTALPLERNVGAYVLNEGKGPVKASAKATKDAVLITDDMIGQVSKYVDYCTPLIDAADHVKLEMRCELTDILHPGYVVPGTPEVEDGDKPEELQTFGTADLVAVVPRTETGEQMLIVGDLKTGRHKVEAKENKQLMLYALGVLRRLRRRYNITLVRLVIFQPYAGGQSEWDITPEGLDVFAKFASKRAVAALDAFYKGKKNLKAADFKPSADACQWCRFAEKCNAKAKAAVNQLASDGDLADAPGDAEMSPEELKTAWDKLPELRQHIATIEKAVSSALFAGKRVPGLKLVEGKPGNRAWDIPDDIGDLIAQWGIEDLMTKQTLLSPTEAERVMKGHEKWELLQIRISRKPGSPTVAPEDDKRAEWKAASDDDLA